MLISILPEILPISMPLTHLQTSEYAFLELETTVQIYDPQEIPHVF